MIQSMRRNYIIILISFGDGNWFRHFFKQFEGDMTEHPTREKGDSWKFGISFRPER